MRRSTIVFAGTTAFAGIAVAYAHWAQVRDKTEMHKAVVRDKERLRQKRMLAQRNANQLTNTSKTPTASPGSASPSR